MSAMPTSGVLQVKPTIFSSVFRIESALRKKPENALSAGFLETDMVKAEYACLKFSSCQNEQIALVCAKNDMGGCAGLRPRTMRRVARSVRASLICRLRGLVLSAQMEAVFQTIQKSHASSKLPRTQVY